MTTKRDLDKMTSTTVYTERVRTSGGDYVECNVWQDEHDWIVRCASGALGRLRHVLVHRSETTLTPGDAAIAACQAWAKEGWR